MSFHKDVSKLKKEEDIEYAFDLICPFLSDTEELIKCMGVHCGHYNECFKEMNYKERLIKFATFSRLIISVLIFLALVFY